ncbi:MAG: type II toxin-antitoxin system HicB family antitoxin [Bacteroidales bacterium]|jgi:predicted RNase H-like HicB family nuclease|nr:type II toxin-antitoxin system HicB family antitoxin [Bacteroidales bacterium]
MKDKKTIPTITVIIESDCSGGYSAYINDESASLLDYGLIAQGKTTEETINNFKQAYDEMRKVYKEKGRFFQEAEITYVHDVRAFLNYYAQKLSLSGLERISGIHQKQLSYYLNGRHKPTRKTALRLNTALHSFAQELDKVRVLV